jgi:hypothetical protein
VSWTFLTPKVPKKKQDTINKDAYGGKKRSMKESNNEEAIINTTGDYDYDNAVSSTFCQQIEENEEKIAKASARRILLDVAAAKVDYLVLLIARGLCHCSYHGLPRMSFQ